MVYGWPDGHTFKHLKHEVLLNLIKEREAFSSKLQHHLDKQPLCYKDAVLKINSRDSDKEIPPELGDCILAAISLTIGISIFLMYPTVEHSKDNNNRPIVTNAAHTEYLFQEGCKQSIELYAGSTCCHLQWHRLLCPHCSKGGGPYDEELYSGLNSY